MFGEYKSFELRRQCYGVPAWPPAPPIQLAHRAATLPDTGRTDLPQVEAGTVRLLAVTGPERSKLPPDVPAANETVKGFQATNWYGVLAPQGLDPTLREKIWTELDRIMKMPEIAEKMAGMGLEYPGLGAGQFKAELRQDQRRWAAAIKELGISPD